MRRLALIAAVAAAAACRKDTTVHDPGPLDRFFFPTGVAVLPVSGAAGEHRLVVVSSNADLTYDSETGGSVISVNPEPGAGNPVPVTGGVDIKSFAGELALLYPAACPALGAAAAFVPIRGQDLVYRLSVGADGSLACDPAGCTIPVGSSSRGDPWSAGVACDTAASPGGPSIARAYLGYLRQGNGETWLTQIDLLRSPGADGYVQHMVSTSTGGQIRGMAYDALRRRLYLTHTVIGAATALKYVDLSNGCRIDVDVPSGGCPRGQTPDYRNSPTGSVPEGLELHGIALANETDPTSPVRRAYVSARIYDPVASGQAGGRVGDFDGVLLVVDLSQDAAGNLRFDVVNELPLGYGAADVEVLPARAGKRDVVAALATDDGVVWIYDDDTGARVAIGRDPGTGAPSVGHTPYSLAAAPEVLPGTNTARVYVGSFDDDWVTPIDVPLDDPTAATIPLDAQNNPRRLTGGVL